MVGSEEMLEVILNHLEEQKSSKCLWTKDKENSSKGYLVYEDDDGIGIFIVTIEEGKVELVQ